MHNAKYRGRAIAAILIALMVALLGASCRGNPEQALTIDIETEVSYARGDGFMSSDFKVIATLPDGSVRDVSEAASFSLRDGHLITGNTTVTASYNGVTDQYTIEPKGEVVGIMVASEPTRTEYDEDTNRISYSGLSVITLSTSGISKVVAYGDPRLTMSVAQGTVIVSDTEVTVTYMDSFSAKLQLTYGGEIEKQLENITITGYPKTVYESGDEFDLTGLTVLGQWDDGTVSVIPSEELSVSPKNGTVLLESMDITVTYGDFTVKFPVTVEGSAEVTGFELAERPDYNGYLSFQEVEEGFDKKGLIVRALYSDGTYKVIGDEDITYSESPIQGQVTIYAANTAAKEYSVYIEYGDVESLLYKAGYASVTSIKVVTPPEDTKIAVDEFQNGAAFKGLGMTLYAEYSGNRAPDFLEPGDEGLDITAVDNGNGTWTAFAEYGGVSVNIGTYTFLPESFDTGLTIKDSLGREIEIENGDTKVNMIGEGAFSVRIDKDVSGYKAEWYVNGDEFQPLTSENSNFTFTGFDEGGFYVVTAIFSDGTTMGAGSVSFTVEVTAVPGIVENN